MAYSRSFAGLQTHSLPATASPPHLSSAPQDSEDLSKDHSQQRLLFLMDSNTFPVDLDNELQVQLRAKDVLIEQLNAKLITAEAQARRHESESRIEKDRPLKEVLREKEALVKELEEIRGVCRALEAKQEEASLNSEALKETLEVQIEALTEDNEALKVQLHQRSEALAAAKADISQMSQIVQDLTRLNSDLNVKIASMNEEMEGKNNQHYQAAMKALNTEELEKELVASKTDTLKLQQKVEELKGVEAEKKDLKMLLHATAEELITQLAQITVVDERTREAVRSVDELLRRIGEKAARPDQLPARQIAALKQKVSSLHSEVANYKRAANIAITEKLFHQSQVENIRTESAKLKREYEGMVKQLEEKVKLIQGSVDYAFRTRKKVELNLESAASELARKTSECVYLAGKLDSLKDWESDLKSTKEDLKRNYGSLQERYFEVNRLFAQSEQTTIGLKKDLRAALTKVAVLKEELWKRDNKLLRKECRKIKLMEQVDSLRSTIQVNYTRYHTFESSEKGKRPPLPRIHTNQGVRLLKPTPELLSSLEQCLHSQQTGQEAPQAVVRLKTEYLPYLRSIVGVEDAASYPNLHGLFAFLAVTTLTVQQVIDQITSLSA